MKQTFKLILALLVLSQIVFMSSCEENLQVSCDDFSISIDYDVVDSTFVTLTAQTIGGQAEFDYLWNTGETTPTITIDEVSTYSVTVVDANACTASLDFVIDTTDACSDFSAVMGFDSSGNTLVLFPVISGGTAPFALLWTQGQTTEVVEVNAEGVYSVMITDSEGCVTTATYEHTVAGCSYDLMIVDGVDAMGLPFLTVLIDSVAAPSTFTYEWSTGETTPEISPTVSGIYTVIVTDSEGCTTVATYTFENAGLCDGFAVNITVSQDSTSTPIVNILEAQVVGGLPAYQYTWSNGAAGTSVITVPDESSSYTVTVYDSNNCVVEDTIQL